MPAQFEAPPAGHQMAVIRQPPPPKKSQHPQKMPPIFAAKPVLKPARHRKAPRTVPRRPEPPRPSQRHYKRFLLRLPEKIVALKKDCSAKIACRRGEDAPRPSEDGGYLQKGVPGVRSPRPGPLQRRMEPAATASIAANAEARLLGFSLSDGASGGSEPYDAVRALKHPVAGSRCNGSTNLPGALCRSQRRRAWAAPSLVARVKLLARRTGRACTGV